VEFPNENGKLNLAGFVNGTSFFVYGDDAGSAASATDTSTSKPTASEGVSASFGTVAQKPKWFSKGKSSKSQEPKITVRVVYAELTSTGKPQPSTKQTFVPIYREEDATVVYIVNFVSKSMGEKVQIVGNNGIPYKDEAGTRG
jgi:hypothetical protein